MCQVTAIITCMTDDERPFVGDAVRSVLDQTVKSKVCIYVENGNTWIDGILRDIPGVAVRRIAMQDLGPVRNIGVEEAETDWIAFLDGDDVWMPTKLERQLGNAEVEVDLVGADHILMDESGRTCAYAMAKYIPMPSSWLVRRDTMRAMPFEGGLSQDGKWWRRYMGATQRVRVPECLIGYRVRRTSLSSASMSKRRKVAAVRIAGIPGLRPVVLGATWLGHRANRSRVYSWLPEWGPKPG